VEHRIVSSHKLSQVSTVFDLERFESKNYFCTLLGPEGPAQANLHGRMTFRCHLYSGPHKLLALAAEVPGVVPPVL